MGVDGRSFATNFRQTHVLSVVLGGLVLVGASFLLGAGMEQRSIGVVSRVDVRAYAASCLAQGYVVANCLELAGRIPRLPERVELFCHSDLLRAGAGHGFGCTHAWNIQDLPMATMAWCVRVWRGSRF